jgi:hypothetical protein
MGRDSERTKFEMKIQIDFNSDFKVQQVLMLNILEVRL